MLTVPLDPLVPRSIDLPTAVPLEPSADLRLLDGAKILAAPDDPAQRDDWRRALERWRAEAQDRTGYSDALYREPAMAWTSACYSVCLAWLWDEALYDHAACRFTPESFVADAQRDFGGFDAVVLWQAYPVIGLDERNQFDFYRDVPGLGELIADFHRLGLRVFLDFNPWDTGTRREPVGDAEALAGVVADLNADGVFLDTLREGGADLREALVRRCGHIALEGESSVPLARLADHALSWAQWCADSPTPGVLRAHWYERRHMLHQTRRWNRDHSEELQTAWLNGCGMLVWETVFGSWVGWNPRDRSTLRRMLPVQRRFHQLLTQGHWTPLAGDAPGPVFASRLDADGTMIWLLANRSPEAAEWAPEELPGDHRWFDLIDGIELPMPHVQVPGSGVGAVLAVPGSADIEDLAGFLASQAALPRTSDASFPVRQPSRVTADPAVANVLPRGMKPVAGGEREVTICSIVRETGLYGGAPFVEEWKPLPPRLHALNVEVVRVHLGSFAIDELEVSNDQFAAFLAATGYSPAEPLRFLEHWEQGRPAPGQGSLPVTYVQLADARAYAVWRGARLPTEHEWQAAAESGMVARRSPLVWNWTESEHSDGRTRWAILKGGAAFQAEGSEWYFPGGSRPPGFSAKLLLCGGGLARSSQVGFRCAVDLESGS